jgi:uncharacterized membrane protein YdfJ with MMPL/SSD domain
VARRETLTARDASAASGLLEQQASEVQELLAKGGVVDLVEQRVVVAAALIMIAVFAGFVFVEDPMAWWLPRWLDKVMPNVDIEGESLRTPQK